MQIPRRTLLLLGSIFALSSWKIGLIKLGSVVVTSRVSKGDILEEKKKTFVGIFEVLPIGAEKSLMKSFPS